MFHVRTCRSHGRILSGELYKEIIKKEKKMSPIDIACWIILHVFFTLCFSSADFFFSKLPIQNIISGIQSDCSQGRHFVLYAKVFNQIRYQNMLIQSLPETHLLLFTLIPCLGQGHSGHPYHLDSTIPANCIFQFT